MEGKTYVEIEHKELGISTPGTSAGYIDGYAGNYTTPAAGKGIRTSVQQER